MSGGRDRRRAPAPSHPAHEASDANVPGILLAFGALVVAAVVLHAAVWIVMVWLDRPGGPRPSDAWRTRPAMAVPGPRFEGLRETLDGAGVLQADPAAAMDAFRARERDLLHRYRWIDRQAGIVQVPIEQAMELLAASGEEAPPLAPADLPPAGGSPAPTDANAPGPRGTPPGAASPQ